MGAETSFIDLVTPTMVCLTQQKILQDLPSRMARTASPGLEFD